MIPHVARTVFAVDSALIRNSRKRAFILSKLSQHSYSSASLSSISLYNFEVRYQKAERRRKFSTTTNTVPKKKDSCKISKKKTPPPVDVSVADPAAALSNDVIDSIITQVKIICQRAQMISSSSRSAANHLNHIDDYSSNTASITDGIRAAEGLLKLTQHDSNKLILEKKKHQDPSLVLDPHFLDLSNSLHAAFLSVTHHLLEILQAQENNKSSHQDDTIQQLLKEILRKTIRLAKISGTSGTDDACLLYLPLPLPLYTRIIRQIASQNQSYFISPYTKNNEEKQKQMSAFRQQQNYHQEMFEQIQDIMFCIQKFYHDDHYQAPSLPSTSLPDSRRVSAVKSNEPKLLYQDQLFTSLIKIWMSKKNYYLISDFLEWADWKQAWTISQGDIHLFAPLLDVENSESHHNSTQQIDRFDDVDGRIHLLATLEKTFDSEGYYSQFDELLHDVNKDLDSTNDGENDEKSRKTGSNIRRKKSSKPSSLLGPTLSIDEELKKQTKSERKKDKLKKLDPEELALIMDDVNVFLNKIGFKLEKTKEEEDGANDDKNTTSNKIDKQQKEDISSKKPEFMTRPTTEVNYDNNSRFGYDSFIYMRHPNDPSWLLPDITQQLIKHNNGKPLKYTKEYEESIMRALRDYEEDEDERYGDYSDEFLSTAGSDSDDDSDDDFDD